MENTRNTVVSTLLKALLHELQETLSKVMCKVWMHSPVKGHDHVKHGNAMWSKAITHIVEIPTGWHASCAELQKLLSIAVYIHNKIFLQGIHFCQSYFYITVIGQDVVTSNVIWKWEYQNCFFLLQQHLS